MLNKTICCLSDLIYFICSTRHLNTYKKCSGRKIFWTKYFKFTAAFSDSHHHSSRIYSVRVFVCGRREAKLTKPRESGMLDINPNQAYQMWNFILYIFSIQVTSVRVFFLLHIFYNWDWRSKSNWIKLTAAGFIRGKDWTKSNYLIYLHFIGKVPWCDDK